jgi:hypothetical protein
MPYVLSASAITWAFLGMIGNLISRGRLAMIRG